MTDKDDLTSLEKLDKAIKEAKQKASGETNSEKPASVGDSARVFVELLSGSAVGFGLGFWLDGIFETTPLLLITCGMLGIAGAFYNIIRAFNMRSNDINED